MISFEKFKEEMRERGVVDFTPLDYSFILMIAFGTPLEDAYLSTYKWEEYEKKNDRTRPDFIKECKEEAKRKMENKMFIEMFNFLTLEYENQVKEATLDLGDKIELSSGDIKKITARLLSDKASDISNVDTKDIISAIKLYMDNFIDTTNDNERLFARHFIEIHSPCNMVCTHCNHEFRILEGISQKCPNCNHLYSWDSDRERFID